MLTPFRIILDDCPWRYNDRKATRRDNPARKPKFGVGVERRYSAGTMSTQELRELGPLVKPLCTPDAYNFKWATCPMLPAALSVMEAWGFRFITVHAVWVKVYPGIWLLITGGKLLLKVVHLIMGGHIQEACAELGALVEEALNKSLFRGGGRYSPSNIELLLLGVKGRPWHPNTGWKPRQVIIAPHPRKPLTGKIWHSRKPEIFQDEIDRWLFPHLDGAQRLELFATRQRPGWTCLGHALTGTDIREDLRGLASEKEAA